MKHKFINKKAGAEARVIAMYLDSDGVMQVDGYDTVEDLMDDYAAYGKYEPPREPLIKDEKIRKAVRAWAEANRDVGQVTFSKDVTGKSYSYLADTDSDAQIKFNFVVDGELDTYEVYAIAELCGEEEE